MMKRLALAVLLVMSVAVPAAAEGWRPPVRSETDAEWLTQMDARLAPIHGVLLDTLTLVGSGTETEADAYVTIIQENAIKGLRILDLAGDPPACAADYAALERAMFLMFGDTADAFRQFRAGSSQALDELNALAPAATYLLTTYGTTIRDATDCGEAEPEPTPEPSTGPARTATPTQ
jgi:hypothetical protein